MLTATLYTYSFQCARKMWLHHHKMVMEHTSDLVSEGRVLHETSYRQRANRYREIALEGMKIDHFDARQGIIREVKKSDKRERAHVAQVKFYLWRLEQVGISTQYGLLEYPAQRKTLKVFLADSDRMEIPQQCAQIQGVLDGTCPERLAKNRCRHCSYLDFCWSGESLKPNT
ncbi:CRISPR-associated protein Cas4 [Pontibacter sp. G13]|uniref:CRISPR-associated protein Cas4 n=1 Tax=Pontibacter sp. G13 TaxID=3074898 RepID=UPI00288C095A|nr:CRISPR-associated protein Cas4 [Pontibacter sp. G13]WNJ20036.1 CRISPR-associated protein Cas4 [Pontibacter sp. G13]